MPAMDGFGVFQSLDAETLPIVIFVTAHDRFALKAFEVHAADYLLKPIDFDYLGRALPATTYTVTNSTTGSTVTVSVATSGRVSIP